MANRGQKQLSESLTSLDTRRALLFALLFIVAVPWYWSAFERLANRAIWGFPVWFVGAVLGSILISATAAWCFSVPWSEEQDAPVEPDDNEMSSSK